jgi:hypothetical protein
MHIFAIFLLYLIHVGVLHQFELIWLRGHLLGEKIILYLSPKRKKPQNPVISKDLFDILNLSAIVQVELNK